ncbi:4Fe-4S binding protein [Bradyrhizobium hipponense]|nr:4Fe-4S binding protein [Bradyrhizobium hipponense]
MERALMRTRNRRSLAEALAVQFFVSKHGGLQDCYLAAPNDGPIYNADRNRFGPNEEIDRKRYYLKSPGRHGEDPIMSFATRHGHDCTPDCLISIDPQKCTGCGRCFKICRLDIITVEEIQDEGDRADRKRQMDFSITHI